MRISIWSPSLRSSASTTAVGNRTARLLPHFDTCIGPSLIYTAIVYQSSGGCLVLNENSVQPTVGAIAQHEQRTTGSVVFQPDGQPRCVQLLVIFKYLAVPNSLVSCCEYLKSPR